jgi:hypothetical protein
MISKDLENENRIKYGDKDNDLIAQIERKNPYIAVIICAFSKIKYETRIANGINKNGTDGEKIYDYDVRLQTICHKYKIPYFDVLFDYLDIKTVIFHIWKRYKQ